MKIWGFTHVPFHHWLSYFPWSSPISWKTKKQTTVSCFSAEAEYHSMATTTCELIQLRTLLNDLKISHPLLAQLHCHNHPAIHIAANPVHHDRTKYIEIDCHFICDCIKFGHGMFLLIFSWLTSSPNHWVIINLTSLLASWAFVVFMLQLEGVYWKKLDFPYWKKSDLPTSNIYLPYFSLTFLLCIIFSISSINLYLLFKGLLRAPFPVYKLICW